ncbi:MAG TPA: hypothetical protein VFP00_05055 [Burkholderiales bacterium]|nr:hypothetical protein [Burkholderiales bacterium]
MPFFHDLLRRIGSDPVKYALRIVFFLGVVLLVFLLIAGEARAQPIFFADFESGRVTLTDEPCTLKAVTNAPKRVTWREPNGRLSEGCYGLYTLRLPHGKVDIIIGYFDDLTLQVLPLSAFSVLRAI